MRPAFALVLLLCVASALADKTLASACGHLVSSLSPSVKHSSDLVSICARHPDRAVQAACFNWTKADASMLLNFARSENVQMADIICPIFTALPPKAQHLLGGCSWLEKAGCAVAIAGAVTGCGFVPLSPAFPLPHSPVLTTRLLVAPRTSPASSPLSASPPAVSSASAPPSAAPITARAKLSGASNTVPHHHLYH